MLDSLLRIRDRDYPLDDASLIATFYELDDDAYLELNVMAAAGEDDSGAGVTLNCIAFPGARVLDDLIGKSFEIGGLDDQVNDIGESVIWEPGHMLSLDSLTLSLLEHNEERAVLELQAVCTRLNEETYEMEERDIPVSGYLVARLDG